MTATFLDERQTRDDVLMQDSSLVEYARLAGPNLVAEDASGLFVAGPNLLAQVASGVVP